MKAYARLEIPFGWVSSLYEYDQYFSKDLIMRTDFGFEQPFEDILGRGQLFRWSVFRVWTSGFMDWCPKSNWCRRNGTEMSYTA